MKSKLKFSQNKYCYQSTFSSQVGFTLIEFLVVAVILSIVGSIGVMSFMPSLEKSRDGRRKADLANVTKALEAYNTDHGSYPQSADGFIIACGRQGDEKCAWGDPFTDEKGTVYMARLPEDPRRFEYFYLFDPTTNGYALLARLENEQDPIRAVTAGNSPQRGVYTFGTQLTENACGGSGCSYVQYGPAVRPALIIVADDLASSSEEAGASFLEETGEN